MYADLIQTIDQIISIESLIWAVLIVIALLSLRKMMDNKTSNGKKWFRIETVEEDNDESKT